MAFHSIFFSLLIVLYNKYVRSCDLIKNFRMYCAVLNAKNITNECYRINISQRLKPSIHEFSSRGWSWIYWRRTISEAMLERRSTIIILVIILFINKISQYNGQWYLSTVTERLRKKSRNFWIQVIVAKELPDGRTI